MRILLAAPTVLTPDEGDGERTLPPGAELDLLSMGHVHIYVEDPTTGETGRIDRVSFVL